jgi:hypothetical protein
MSYGLTRIHGGTVPGVFHGGYQLRWFKIADTGYDSTPSAVESKFERAVRIIESVATVVVLGEPTSSGFVVGVDYASYDGRKVDGSDVAAATLLDNLITAGIDGLTVTEATILGLTFTDI